MTLQRTYPLAFVFSFLLFTMSCDMPKKKNIDWGIGLSQKGKKPYDTYIAYKLLPYYFPDAGINTLYSNYDFTKINEANYQSQEGHAMVVLIGKSITFSKVEWASLMQFMRSGNELVMASAGYDKHLQSDFHFTVSNEGFGQPLTSYNSGFENVAALSLARYPLQRFGIQGRSLRSYFVFEQNGDSLASSLDFSVAQKPKILGFTHTASDTSGKPNMLQYAVGAGHLTILASPMMFTNYFLLQQKNRLYFDNIWQVIDGDIYQIYWGNYTSRAPNEGAWVVLMRHPATRWAVILLLLLTLTFLLVQVRRQQRIIPIIKPNENSSLAFVQTVAMLYYNKGDNQNLASKIDLHFMEWLRSHCYLDTRILDADFINKLSRKTGITLADTKALIAIIHQVRLKANISDELLLELYQRTQQFYKSH